MSEETQIDDGFLGAAITVEDPAFGSVYPVIQWINGAPANKKTGGVSYTGGFFLSDDQGVEPPKGFEPHTMITSEGVEVLGYASPMLNGSVIRTRRCWMSEPESGLAQRFGWNEYDEASGYGTPRGVCHVLFGIPGYDEPVLLVFRGMVAKQIMGQGRGARGIIPQFGQKVIGTAKRLARKQSKNISYPLCTFGLTMGGKLEADGKTPSFDKVGQPPNTSMVTYPIWRDEPTQRVDQAILNRLFVGNEALALYQDWHLEAEEWVRSWDAETLTARARRTPGASLPSGDEAAAAPGDNEVPF